MFLNFPNLTLKMSREHLYWRHMSPPNLCARCMATFDSDQELREHLRASIPCELNPDRHVESITPEKEKAIKSKKRDSKTGTKNDEQTWNEIYKLLFPSIL